MRGASTALLSVRHLMVDAGARQPVLEDVSFDITAGSVLALVGESGSGKTLAGLAITRLLPAGVRVSAGEIWFEGTELLGASEAHLTQVRGRRIGVTFQEPSLALSPIHTVGWQLETALRATSRGGREAARSSRAKAIALLGEVGLPSPERLLDARTHQLSAGMRRRVALAIALSGDPALLIADSPTTGLDTPIQAQILELLARLVRERKLAVLFITRDLGAVAELASELIILYGGQVVECGPVGNLFRGAQHPYTRSLFECIPDRVGRFSESLAPAISIRAPRPPELAEDACRFALRCAARVGAPERFPRCLESAPALEPASAKHRSRCFYPHISSASRDD
jgi:oligopeptide/dipeptide ABC transporter ATP-binding protein